MIPAVNQYRVAISRLKRLVAAIRTGVQMLKCKALRLADAVVINLIQVDFARRIVNIVLVRRITSPVPTRRINLNRHKFVSWTALSDNVTNLILRYIRRPKAILSDPHSSQTIPAPTDTSDHFASNRFETMTNRCCIVNIERLNRSRAVY